MTDPTAAGTDLGELKRGDVYTFADTLTAVDAATGVAAAFDLADCTVLWIARNGPYTLSREATVDDVAAGQVSYTTTAADLVYLGEHLWEWEVTRAGEPPRTFPSGGWNRFTVVADLNP